MSQPQTDPEALRRKLSNGMPQGYTVVYLKHEDTYLVTRKGRLGGPPGQKVLRRLRETVEKWRNPESTIAFAVKYEERKRA